MRSAQRTPPLPSLLWAQHTRHLRHAPLTCCAGSQGSHGPWGAQGEGPASSGSLDPFGSQGSMSMAGLPAGALRLRLHVVTFNMAGTAPDGPLPDTLSSTDRGGADM